MRIASTNETSVYDLWSAFTSPFPVPTEYEKSLLRLPDSIPSRHARSTFWPARKNSAPLRPASLHLPGTRPSSTGLIYSIVR
jgi:hypothetical protein